MHSTSYILSTLLSLSITTVVAQFSTSTTSYSPVPHNTQPPPPPQATGELRQEFCFAGSLSNRRFSRDAAVSMITTVCNDLIKNKVVFGPNDNRHLPAGAPFDGDSRKQGSQIANDSAILFVHPDFMSDACPGPINAPNPTLMTTNFGDVSLDDCMAPFMKAVDNCGDFQDNTGVFWKWGGSVNENCITYTVDANVDTQFAPGPGY